MSAKPQRSLWRLHLSTIIVLVFLAFEIALVNLDLAFAALVLGAAAAILEFVQRRPREPLGSPCRSQFHLSTALLIVLLTGLLLHLNFQVYKASRADYYGFPFYLAYYKREGGLFLKHDWRPYGEPSTWYYSPRGIAGNLVFIAISVLCIAIVSEGYIRFSKRYKLPRNSTFMVLMLFAGVLFCINRQWREFTVQDFGWNYGGSERGWPLAWVGDFHRTNWLFAAIDLGVAAAILAVSCYFLEKIPTGPKSSEFASWVDRKFKLRTSTALVATLVAFQMLWFNIQPRNYLFPKGANEGTDDGRWYKLVIARGWPLEFHDDNSLPFNILALAVNLLLAMAILKAATLVCEWLIRKISARANRT